MGYRRGDKQDYSAEAFRQIYAMLKPGGVLGVVDHRLPESASAEREQTSGYIKVSTVRALAQAAGYRLAAASEINANPRDTADWPGGVWTLPPSLIAQKFKDEYQRPDHQLQLILFLDGHAGGDTAQRGSASDFAETADRPGLTWFNAPR